MKSAAVLRPLGVLLVIFSVTLLPPAGVAYYYGDDNVPIFLACFAGTLLAGLAILLPTWPVRRELRIRDGFLLVVLFWGVLGVIGAIPLMLSDIPRISPTDALFESFSGLTTTGATVMTGIEHMPESLQYYRQQLQWLGGMGIIVLAVAILPMLGVGGMQLFRAEMSGPMPMKENKLTPRITETARALWYIYVALTAACALAYWLAGMSPFDAIGHAFSTVSIGGFSTYDANFAAFDSVAIEAVAMVFILIAGINFAFHFMALRHRSVAIYLRDEEIRVFVSILGAVALAVIAGLYLGGIYGEFGNAVRYGLFQAVSIATTTGFANTDFYTWPAFLPALLIGAAFIGACAGSTGGGIKVIRAMMLYKQGVREILRLIHPNAQLPVKLGGNPVPYQAMDAIWGFFALYVAAYGIMSLLVAATGIDLVTAFSAVAATQTNLGPGLGDVGPNYEGLTDFAKWVLTFAMLLGRLEVFTVLVLLTPAFWRS